MIKHTYRSFLIFGLLAIPIGIIFTIMGGGILHENTTRNLSQMSAGLFIMIIGIGMGIGGIFSLKFHFKNFVNHNKNMHDDTSPIIYDLYVNRKLIEFYNDSNEVCHYVNDMESGDCIEIILKYDFLGLKSWTFRKLKNAYISFITINEKNTYKEYFIMPQFNSADALTFYLNTFNDRNGVDSTQLIDMKRLDSVIEFYKLYPKGGFKSHNQNISNSNNSVYAANTSNHVHAANTSNSVHAANTNYNIATSKLNNSIDASNIDIKNVRNLINNNQKILAIKYVRDTSGCGIAQAKDWVENIEKQQ